MVLHRLLLGRVRATSAVSDDRQDPEDLDAEFIKEGGSALPLSLFPLNLLVLVFVYSC